MADLARYDRIGDNSVAMTAWHLILVYVITLLCALSGVVIYTEFRQRRFKPTASNDRIFRCAKCGYVYTDDPDVDRSRCSQCGQLNEAIEF
jgi:hypothetical protein